MPAPDHENKCPQRICYLTGEVLKTPKEAYHDYLACIKQSVNPTTKPLPQGEEPLDPARESLEHIIPNAIGGKLKSKNILSHAGNQKLNDEVDKDFVKIFASFTSRLSLNKDRKSSPSVSAFHLAHQVKLNSKDGKYFPVSPHYDEKTKTIYAYPLKNAQNYKQRLIKEGVISEQDEIRLADDMAGPIDVPFGLDNQNFKQGMAKIAIGYAALNGLAREQLGEALNVQTNEIASKILLVPSFPTSQSEDYFEKHVATSPHYPCHTLTLCGHDGILYCHIELFNAFQWYVILSFNYRGNEIFHAYTHDLLNDTEITREDYIASVELPAGYPAIQDFRKVPPQLLARLAEKASMSKETLDSYNHFKFNQLSHFTQRHFVYNKAVALGIIEEEPGI